MLSTVVTTGTGDARADPRTRSSPARPARRRTTATPGSSAGREKITRRGLGRLSGRAARRCRPSSTASRSPAAPIRPAIWKTFMERALAIKEYAPEEEEEPDVPVAPAPTASGDARDARARRRRRRRPRTPRRRGEGGGTEPAPEAPAPAEPAPAEPAPEAAGARRAAAERQRGEVARAGRARTDVRQRSTPSGDRRSRRYAARRSPAGHGRDTLREPTAQKRHSSSAAFVIPMRVPATTSTSSQPGGRGADPDRPADEVGAVELELDRERLRQLARPGAELLDGVQAAPLAHRVERRRSARARGSAPPRRRPRARRPR